MAPFELELLLEAHYLPDLLEDSRHKDAPIFSGTLNNLISRGLIDSDNHLTEKGDVYIDAILNLPLPVCKWIMPSD